MIHVVEEAIPLDQRLNKDDSDKVHSVSALINHWATTDTLM